MKIFLKRVALLLVVNFLIMITISFFCSVFKIAPFFTHYGINYYSLLFFCFMWGMSGAFISLFLSSHIAKWLMKVVIITENDVQYQNIFIIVKKLIEKSSLKFLPQIGVYQSNEVNAFATGPTKKKSLIALSSALVDQMKEEEIMAIIGHEISHIENGDMVTMTLLQGIINSFVMFLARVLAFAISGMSSKNEKSKGSNFLYYYLLVSFFDFIFMLLGYIILSFFSKKREFRADKGGARLTTTDSMVNALSSLKIIINNQKKDKHMMMRKKDAFSYLKVCSYNKNGLKNIFSTHPSLDDRIKQLMK